MHALLGRFGRERSEGDAAIVDGAWAAALAVWRTRAAREIDPDSGRWLRWHPHDLEQALGALALARRAGDDLAFALAMAWLCTLQPAVRVDERQACARAAFERAGDRVGLALMLGERALRLAFCGRHDEAGPLLREAQEIFHALGDPLRLAKTHQTLAVAPLLRGDLDAARRHVATVRGAFEAAGFVDQPTTVGAWLAILEGPREAAAGALDRLDAVMRRLGVSGLWAGGLRCAYLVRFGTASAVAAQARSLLAAPGLPDDPMSAYADLVLADALVRLGDLGAAGEALAEGVRVARALHAPRFVAHAALVAAHLAEARGASDEARRLLAAAAVRPAVEHAVLEDARPLASRLGLAWPPEVPAVAEDDDVLQERVEAFLGGMRSHSA